MRRLFRALLGTAPSSIEIARKNISGMEIYKELREAEWLGSSLSECITALEQRYPELRETDAELVARFRTGSRLPSNRPL